LDGLHVKEGKQDRLRDNSQPFRHHSAQFSLDDTAEQQFFTDGCHKRDTGDQPAIAQCR